MTKKITIIGMIIVIFLGIGSFFVIPKKEIELKELNEPNITFAYVIDGSKSEKAPTKDSGYAFDDANSSCINGTEIYWDTDTWSAKIKNLKNTKTTCTISFNKKYTEGILKGTDPVLGNGMIPITIEDNGTVHKADISKDWYKYAEKKWANAVILVDETKEYKNEEVIPEENIESYFVWIPRYKYYLKQSEATYNGYTSVTKVGNIDNVNDFYNQHSNLASKSVFEIAFEDKNKTNTTETNPNEWLLHPAFAAFDSNGFWVGKFETGYNQNDDNNNVTPTSDWNSTESEKNIKNSSKVIIKPNVYSWRGINVSNAFYTSYEYKRELESHMMKNMEWGAVAYLTQSNYGRCTNGICTEVRMNNSGNYITGRSAKTEPTCGYTDSKEECNWYEEFDSLTEIPNESIASYYDVNSQISSTTGNYYGIYDMSGGSWEYVMGVMQSAADDTSAPASGRSKTYNSGFDGPYSCPTCDNQTEKENTNGNAWPSKKYYDLYDYDTSNQQYQRGTLGDGTKEVGPFYSVNYVSKEFTRAISSYNSDTSGFVNYPVTRLTGLEQGISLILKFILRFIKQVVFVFSLIFYIFPYNIFRAVLTNSYDPISITPKFSTP